MSSHIDTKQEHGSHCHEPEVSLAQVEALRQGTFGTTDLSTLGLAEAAERDIGPLDIICVGWNICNSWIGLAATIALTIAQGGSVTLIYGVIVCFVMVGCSGLTLAELASVYPTAGGQYHWTSILTPAKPARILSYACGITNVYSWIATSAGIAIIVAQVVIGMVIFTHPDYVPATWHYFLVYQAVNLVLCLHNIFTMKRSMWINDVSFAVTLTGFFAIIVTCLARAPHKQSSELVWTDFVNESGWPNGVSFLTGLVSPNYMYAGIDGAIHLAEECKNPAKVVPRAIVSTLTIGFITSFAFAVSMTYCIQDFTAVIGTVTGVPVYEIWHQATGSKTAASIFMAVVLLAALVALAAVQQTASRLTWSFARDSALVGSQFFGQIHPRLGVPVWSLVANAFVVLIIGCIYLGSSTAFNAFIGTSLLLQQITYAFPAALLMYRKRKARYLPVNRPFKLPGAFGWIANFATVAFAVVVLIFYNFPVVLPVIGSTMNYTSAVIAAMALFAAINWFIHARTKYHGPRLAEF
ncbi:hypothetical protein, variant [Exophiala oligosperma]|uniref:Amino acid permease/ SLC12A domain-containing protein n=1 Tax=Exophiala oligosperma TaxID=215243 RepID=A0A0D2DNE1_9EURO|nr:uncharacterized protein PV06_10361 [Exophiala oligosperma]XP_016257526.1 hypothetical protein, variant [Exophiala oligosperma]KIW37309.1 hypothetical protein PV06_10361 [Exophiala oligosperma]KIW37310.1 hypothetical protein, variant [Exophiala oligosperma]